MPTIQAKIPAEKLNGKKTSRKTFPNILGKPGEAVLFFENLENVVTFATGSRRKFKPDVLVEWKTPHNALCLTAKFYITIVSPGY